VEWAFEVVVLCQRAVLQANTRDRGLFVNAFELLAASLPAPSGTAERVFLADRLREIAWRATREWNRQTANGVLPRTLLPYVAWPAGPMVEDARALLLEWARQSLAEQHTLTHVAPEARAVLQTRVISAWSVSLDALAALDGDSRSLLTRNQRRVRPNGIGLSAVRCASVAVVDELVEQELRSVSARRWRQFTGPRPN
jgi:hypothetical protein